MKIEHYQEFEWCPGAESNHRHEDFQSGAIQGNASTYEAETRQTPDGGSNTYEAIVKPGRAEKAKKIPGAGAFATGDKQLLSKEKPYISGSLAASLSLADTLLLKPAGWYHIEPEGDHYKITVYRPGEPSEVLLCHTLGHANQVRLELSDEGMAGLIEGAE